MNNDSKTITLDCKHKEIINKINIEKTETIPKYYEQLKILIHKHKKTKDNELLIDINNLKKKIASIKKKHKDYYIKNSSYIFEYFEEKKDINTNNNKNKIVTDFFDIQKKTDKQVNVNNSYKYLLNQDCCPLDIEQYIVNTDICKSCNKGEMVVVDCDGIIMCNHCFKYVKILIENDKPVYNEPPKEVCFYAYKRINHFREILSQFQAKETTYIPDSIIINMKKQIKKERKDIQTLTNKQTKDMLKKLGYNKYYEHIPFIKDKLGIKPPVMCQELEDRLCNLFIDIQSPYSKFCPQDRVNFINYYYTIYKLCELLDQTEFLPYFPMLKDREKRIEQDEIWKKICNELGWEYIPTI